MSSPTSASCGPEVAGPVNGPTSSEIERYRVEMWEIYNSASDEFRAFFDTIVDPIQMRITSKERGNVYITDVSINSTTGEVGEEVFTVRADTNQSASSISTESGHESAWSLESSPPCAKFIFARAGMSVEIVGEITQGDKSASKTFE